MKGTLVAGALLAGSGVALGAFGAHALKHSLAPEQAEWWSTAVQYQMWHALALLVLCGLAVRRRGLAALLIGAGAVVFSGSLYLMALGLPRWLGAITPIGGTLMIAGWLVLAWSAFSSAAPGGDS